MPYIPLASGAISAGKSVTNEVTNQIKDNFDNHEERLTDLENGTVVDYPPIIFRVSGPYAELSSTEKTAILTTTVNFSLEITGIRIIIEKAGTSGTTSVDVLKKSGGGSFTSLLSTQPTVLSSAGDYASSTNAILDSAQTTVAAGDLLRLDITSVQTAGVSFMVRIDYEKVG